MSFKCPDCNTDNPDTAHFCAECGTGLKSPNKEEETLTRTLTLAQDELATGSIFAGRYQIIEQIGRGGMGRVYKAFDTEIQGKVALKLIKPEIAADKNSIERFRNELKLARKVAHRYVSQMFDLGNHESTYFITMVYVTGEDLKSFIRRTGQLSVSKALTLAGQIAEGLSEAHRLGVIHRDLKPRNIIIDKDGNARIMDFGIARSVSSKGITEKGIMVGTPEYMSPEQTEMIDVDHRTDLYSLGIVLFEMLTGRVPFEGETPLGVAVKQKTEKPPRPEEFNPQISQDLSRLILKCLEKEPAERYQTVDDLLAALREITAELPTTEITPPRKRPTESRTITVTLGLKKTYIPFLALILLVAAIVIVWQLLDKPQVGSLPNGKPSLAVLYFKNNTGQDQFEHWRTALTDLLVTDLHQSKYVRVLSSERLYGILGDLDAIQAVSYSDQVIKEVGERGRVDRVLVGNYTEAGDTFRINVSLQDARTSEIIASESVEGQGERSFYSLVDELTLWVKSHFELTDQELAEDIDNQVETITTHSPEALKIYSEARQLHLQAQYAESIMRMQEAMRIDPEFAMAYRSVAVSYGNQGQRFPRRRAIEKAFELSDRVSERERLTIRGDYFMTSESTYDRAIDAFESLLKIYPDDRIGNINLGIIYNDLEQYDKAITLFKTIIRIEPDNMLSHWNLAETYCSMGEYAQARQTLRKYLEHDPENASFFQKIGDIYAYEGNYDQMLKLVEKFSESNPDNLYFAFFTRAYIELLQGNFQKAKENFLKLPEASSKRREGLAFVYYHQGKFQAAIEVLQKPSRLYYALADAYLKSGQPEAALEEYQKEWKDALQDGSLRWQVDVLHSQGLAFLQKGEAQEAQRLADQITALVQDSVSLRLIRYADHLLGMKELQAKNYLLAVSHLEKAAAGLYAPEPNFPALQPLFFSTLAEAYLEAGELDKAAQHFKKVLDMALGRHEAGDIYARCFFGLGRVFEQKGEINQAKEQYQRFLSLWEGGDPDLPEVAEARERLLALDR